MWKNDLRKAAAAQVAIGSDQARKLPCIAELGAGRSSSCDPRDSILAVCGGAGRDGATVALFSLGDRSAILPLGGRLFGILDSETAFLTRIAMWPPPLAISINDKEDLVDWH